MRKSRLLLLAILTASCSLPPSEEGSKDGPSSFREMNCERLPSLNTPRGGARTLMLGDELTIIGGHTDGFILLPTLEYLSGGSWHEVPMMYPHNVGFVVVLPDGKVMLGGGSAENFGIGQSWGVEVYDPQTHSCKGIGILDRKRAGCSAMAFPDGRVVVSGNWYAPDAIELYEPGKGFRFLKDVARERNTPWILPSGPDNAIIFGDMDNYGKPLDGMVDRLDGDSFSAPLLEEWAPYSYSNRDGRSGEDYRIGEYTYLIPARRRSDLFPGILKISGEQFSLLDMDRPLPYRSKNGARILWPGRMEVDRSSRVAWLHGRDSLGTLYWAAINYDASLDGGKATVSLFEASDLKDLVSAPCLLPDGRIALPGGTAADSGDLFQQNNFECHADVYVLDPYPEKRTGLPWWPFGLAGVVLMAGAGAWAMRTMRRQPAFSAEPPAATPESGADLMSRIQKLMEEDRLFLNPELRLSDVAAAVGSNNTYVSACINGQLGISFTTLVTRYRVQHAQELLRQKPSLRPSEVAFASGFSSERSFFRCFKAVTGLTPSEWRDHSARMPN